MLNVRCSFSFPALNAQLSTLNPLAAPQPPLSAFQRFSFQLFLQTAGAQDRGRLENGWRLEMLHDQILERA
jgi:hypothetical protein